MSRVASRSLLFALIVVIAADRPALSQPIDTCGTLVLGVNQCVLFELSDGTRYLLNSEGGFAVGTLVHVVGTIEPTCFSTCNQGDGCLSVQTIAACQGQVLPPPSLPTDRCGLCGIGMSLVGWTGLVWWLACRGGRLRAPTRPIRRGNHRTQLDLERRI